MSPLDGRSVKEFAILFKATTGGHTREEAPGSLEWGFVCLVDSGVLRTQKMALGSCGLQWGTSF